MRLRTAQALLFVLALSVFAADFTVGCGQGYVYGPVTQKFAANGEADQYLISVNGTPYSVPYGFWTTVKIGDLVKFTGREWQIVKQGQTTVTPTP